MSIYSATDALQYQRPEDGRVVVIYNHSWEAKGAGRGRLNVAISSDDGVSWRRGGAGVHVSSTCHSLAYSLDSRGGGSTEVCVSHDTRVYTTRGVWLFVHGVPGTQLTRFN